MSKKLGNASPVSDADEPPSGAEFIMGSDRWDERINKARALREKILSGSGDSGVAPSTSGPRRKSALLGKVDPTDTVDTSKQGFEEDVPSLEDILTTANWTDRLAMAAERREQVIAKRKMEMPAQPAPVPQGFTKPYKDVVRGALTDLSPSAHEQTDMPPVSAAFVADQPVQETKQRRYGVMFIGSALVALLVVGAVLIDPVRNLVKSSVGEVVTVFVGPNIASAPRNADVAETLPAAAEPVIAAIPATTDFPVPVIDDAIAVLQFTTLGSVADFGSDIRPFAGDPTVNKLHTAFPWQPFKETKPVVSVETYVAATSSISGNSVAGITSNNAENASLSSPPNLLSFVSVLPRSQAEFTSISQVSMTYSETALLTRNAPIAFPRVENEPVVEIAQNISRSFVPTVISDISIQSKTLVSALVSEDTSIISNHANTWLPPIRATFLSAPADTDTLKSVTVALYSNPVVLDSVGLAPTIVPSEPGVILPSVPKAFTAPGIPKTTSIVASLSLDQEPTIFPDQPESFDAVSTRIEDTAADSVNPIISGDYSIHVRAPSSLSDDKLNAFSAALVDTGFSVNPPRRVGFRVSKNHVRFYHTEDAEAAGLLAAAVEGPARDFTDYRPSPPAGTIEVWLAGKSQPRSNAGTSRRTATQNPALTDLRNRLLQSLRRGDHL